MPYGVCMRDLVTNSDEAKAMTIKERERQLFDFFCRGWSGMLIPNGCACASAPDWYRFN